MSGISIITGSKPKNSLAVEGSVDRANEFSLFYNTFDTWANVCPALDTTAGSVLTNTIR